MMWLSNGERIDDILNRFDAISDHDKRTDIRKDKLLATAYWAISLCTGTYLDY